MDESKQNAPFAVRCSGKDLNLVYRQNLRWCATASPETTKCSGCGRSVEKEWAWSQAHQWLESKVLLVGFVSFCSCRRVDFYAGLGRGNYHTRTSPPGASPMWVERMTVEQVLALMQEAQRCEEDSREEAEAPAA